MKVERKRVTLHPLNEDGTVDTSTNLYPKTFLDGIVDRQGNGVVVATEEYVDTKPNLIEITWFALKSLRDNSQLVPGRFYRITDFVTTTAQARTSSAGHQFDLIVQAIANNKLSEDAQACLHSGDTYFANSQLGAWVIKYCFDNDTNRFAWADATNGKGVIYHMIDEFDNDLPYDFKNIKFARYKITACANCPSLVGKYFGILNNSGDALLSSYMTLDTSDSKYFYTFDCCSTDYSLNAIGTTVTRDDGSTFELNQIQCCRCLIKNDESDSIKMYLNNIVDILESSRDCMFKLSGWSTNATLLGGANSTDITNIYNSIFGMLGTTYVDGYFSMSSHIGVIVDSLITSTEYTTISESDVREIRECCIIGGSRGAIAVSRVTCLGGSTLIAGHAIIGQSDVGQLYDCNISCSEVIIMQSYVGSVFELAGSGATNYFYRSYVGFINHMTMKDNNLERPFISRCNLLYSYYDSFKYMTDSNVTSMRYCDLQVITGCSFMWSSYITCAQDLTGCNFTHGVEYLTISSTTTSQTITNTNFHDVHGTSDNVKNVVIPEDYSTAHTVNIYGTLQKDIILD